MSLTALVVLLGLPILALILLISGLAAIGSAAGGADSGDLALPRDFLAGERSGETNLVAVPVIGGILGEERGGGGFFASATGITYGYSIKEQLAELAEDDKVDGILLELDSPGGTIFGSKAIADGVAEYRERTGKPVVAYVAGISASGGVYAMAGADEIVADHGTLIGSIGVISGPFVRYNEIVATEGGILGGGVTTEGGIDFDYLTAGRGKDLGSPYRDMTDEERKVLEESLDNAYDDFVSHVADRRGLTEAEVENDLGALIYGEVQAKSKGLVDTIGSRDVAYARLAELAGADGDDWRLDRAGGGQPGLWDLLMGATGPETNGSDLVAGTGGNSDLGPLPSFCSGSPTLLAYHGDPALLCAPLLD
jgi:protease-4